MENLDGVLEAEGARTMLASLPPDGWTVVTSGTLSLATNRMRHVGLPVPDLMVTAGDVGNGKPHPEPYLKGAELLVARPDSTCRSPARRSSRPCSARYRPRSSPTTSPSSMAWTPTPQGA